MLPEWLALAILFGMNTRQIVGTGPFGDYRWRDETPKEAQRRLKRQEKKAAKKAEKGETLQEIGF